MSFLDRIIDFLIYSAYLVFRFALGLIPKRFIKAHAFILSRAIYSVTGGYRKIIDKNIEYFLGDRYDRAERVKITKAVYFRFLYYLLIIIRSKRGDTYKFLSEINVENGDILSRAIADNEKIILFTGHYGYWEIIPQYICVNYRPFITIGEKLRNSPKLTNELKKYREQLGLEVIEKRGAIRSIASALKNGKIVGFLTDQAVDNGVNVLLFGKELIWLDTASRLAKQFNAVIIPCFITTDDLEKYTMFFSPAIRPDNSIDKEEDIQRMSALEALSLQNAIEKNPREYFWFHKRLKREIKDFYN